MVEEFDDVIFVTQSSEKQINRFISKAASQEISFFHLERDCSKQWIDHVTLCYMILLLVLYFK